jgi:hypothetical protein
MCFSLGVVVASKEEKKRRAALVQAIVDEDTKRAIDEMPISLKDLGALFDELDYKLGEYGCGHTTKLTSLFLTQQNLNTDLILPWLADSGGHCDCEVLANVEESWESEISKNT